MRQSIAPIADLKRFGTYQEAVASLPVDAEWSSSFGLSTEGGCTVYFRNPKGKRWTVSNGSHNAVAPFAWLVTEL